MRRVTAQISLHFALALQQHRVNDILCVLGPVRSQQCKRQQPLMFFLCERVRLVRTIPASSLMDTATQLAWRSEFLQEESSHNFTPSVEP